MCIWNIRSDTNTDLEHYGIVGKYCYWLTLEKNIK